MEFMIEQNVPKPSHPTKGQGKWQKLLKKMAVGDSVAVNSEESVRGMRSAGYKMGMTISAIRVQENIYRVHRKS
jgi:ribosomal protein L21E